MRCKKRVKKQLSFLEVILIDERTGNVTGNREYGIPVNGSVKIEHIGGEMKIYDGDGDIINAVRWQAGFSQEYKYVYEELNK